MHIFVNLYPVIAINFCVCALQKKRSFINTHFQSRKVHENLVGTQPAREVFVRFFSSYARHFTYAWQFALARLRHRGAMCALNRVRKCACRAAPKNRASKRVNCRLGVCDVAGISAHPSPPSSEFESAGASHARCRCSLFLNSSRL